MIGIEKQPGTFSRFGRILRSSSHIMVIYLPLKSTADNDPPPLCMAERNVSTLAHSYKKSTEAVAASCSVAFW